MIHNSRNLRIGVDARVLMPDTYGGVGEYTYQLLEAMARRASCHTFCLFVNSGRELAGDFWRLLPPNCRLYRWRIPNKALTLAQRTVRRPLCDRLVGGVDVWWSPHFLPAPVSSSCPKVLTVHDLSFLYYPHMFDRKRRLWHWMVRGRREAQEADSIIAVSESTAKDLTEKWGIPKERIKVVYSGVSRACKPITDKGTLAHVQKKYNLPPHFILFLGVVEPRKNLEGLVRG